MTPQEAKELSLEVWEYIKEHSEIRHKGELPKELWEKIKSYDSGCPLCDLYQPKGGVCPGCPLKNCMTGSFYEAWLFAPRNCNEGDDIRRIAASEIVETLKAWEPDKEASNEQIRTCNEKQK